MHRIASAGSTPDHMFQNGDHATGTPSTVVDAAWLNSVQEEISGVVENAGITLGSANNQLLLALQFFFAQLAPVGVVQAYAGTAAPTGWLECAGQSISRTTYAALFAAIGVTYGTVDGTHFTLPDLRGEFLRGYDHGRGIDAGRGVGSFQDWSTAAPKTTTPLRLTDSGTASLSSGASNPSKVGFIRVSKSTESVTVTSGDSSGSGNEPDLFDATTGDAETRPRNLAMMFIIKT
jgi:microcystin-dependent protein